MMTRLWTCCIVTVMGLGTLATAGPPDRPPSQAELIKVLQSDAPLEQKSAACRQLGQVGGPDAVPILAALLGDEKLSHMARYALEQIPAPAAEGALREAAGKLKGRHLAGVLSSLGIRRDAEAVGIIAPLLGEKDAEVASAAAFALGRIATPPAVKTLAGALAGAAEAVKPALWDAALHGADALAAKGNRQEAAGIFDRLRAAELPLHVRVAATRGAVLARGAGGVALLTELLNEKSPASFDLALRLALELPGEEATGALAGQVGKLPADRQALLVQALGNRGDRSAAGAVRSAAGHSDPAVRIAAVRAIAQLGDTSALPILLDAAGAKEKLVAEAAASAVARLPGREVDTALVERLAGSDEGAALIAIDCLARRQAAGATPALLKAAGEGKPPVRLAALKALGEVAGPGDLPAIVGLLSKAGEAAEQGAAERALAAVCAIAPDKEACSDALIAPLAEAPAARKAALLRVLETVHGAKALAAMRAAGKDADPAVRDVAVRALCNWQSPEVAADLLALARDAADAGHRALAVRGYLRLAYSPALPADRRLAMCEQASPLARSDGEKRLLLGALGGIPLPRALAMIAGLIDTPGVREEACTAAVAVAGKLVQAGDLGQVREAILQAMEKVEKTSRDPRCQAGAKKLLARIRPGAPKKK